MKTIPEGFRKVTIPYSDQFWFKSFLLGCDAEDWLISSKSCSLFVYWLSPKLYERYSASRINVWRKYYFYSASKWKRVCPTWHEVTMTNRKGLSALRKQYADVDTWLYETIEDVEYNAKWKEKRILANQEFRIKFRYERDALLFKLRWL